MPTEPLESWGAVSPFQWDLLLIVWVAGFVEAELLEFLAGPRQVSSGWPWGVASRGRGELREGRVA